MHQQRPLDLDYRTVHFRYIAILQRKYFFVGVVGCTSGVAADSTVEDSSTET